VSTPRLKSLIESQSETDYIFLFDLPGNDHVAVSLQLKSSSTVEIQVHSFLAASQMIFHCSPRIQVTAVGNQGISFYITEDSYTFR